MKKKTRKKGKVGRPRKVGRPKKKVGRPRKRKIVAVQPQQLNELDFGVQGVKALIAEIKVELTDIKQLLQDLPKALEERLSDVDAATIEGLSDDGVSGEAIGIPPMDAELQEELNTVDPNDDGEDL